MTNPSDERLRGARAVFANGLRLLSRTALEGSEEAREFRELGDSIIANEGDAHAINLFASTAVEAIDELLSRRAAEQQEPEKPFGYDNATGKTTVTDKWRRKMDALRPASPPPVPTGVSEEMVERALAVFLKLGVPNTKLARLDMRRALEAALLNGGSNGR